MFEEVDNDTRVFSLGGQNNLSSSEKMHMLFPKDHAFKKEAFNDDESISKFLHPHGLCHQLTNFSMDETYYGGKDISIPNHYPNIFISINDPYSQTFSSIDTTSQNGDELKHKEGHTMIYDISLEIVNSYEPSKKESCNDNNDYSDCVERQTVDIFTEVTFCLSK